MVESKVPDAGVDHSVCAECHCCSNDRAGENIVPVVEFVDCQGSADQGCAEDGHVCDDELPVGWVVV